jgi:hypothetical protein
VYLNDGDNYAYLTARIKFNPNCFYIGKIKAIQTWGIINCNNLKIRATETIMEASYIDWENSMIVNAVLLVSPEEADQKYFVEGIFNQMGELNDLRIEFSSYKALKEKYPKILGSNLQKETTQE